MPEANEGQGAGDNVQQESLGWRAALPGDLQQDQTLVPFKTVGDLAKDYLGRGAKVKELEGKLGSAVIKPGDNATDVERGQYLDALGRPKQASEYEFDGEDKNAPEWTNFWKQEFHGIGLTKDQAKALSAKWNTQIQSMVEAANKVQHTEQTQAEQKLRSELGDKYDTNVELAKRFWKQYGEDDFDNAFADSRNKPAIIRMLLKVAAKTGEDFSPQSNAGGQQAKTDGLVMDYSKSPAPPKR